MACVKPASSSARQASTERCPLRRFLPGHMLGADRVPDVHMLDFRPAIDQNRFRMAFQKSMGGERIKVLHGVTRSLVDGLL